MKLYVDPRSSSSLRVLCYVAYKSIELETVTIGLLQGEHLLQAYRAVNPAAAVPALQLDDGSVLTQSLAIIEWLESRCPEPAVAPPSDAFGLAKARAICGFVACDMHPVTNMRVRRRIAALLGDDAAAAWCKERTDEALHVLEQLLQPVAGAWCFGDRPSLADFFVAPALLNAERFGCGLQSRPTLDRIYRTCLATPAFAALRDAR